MTIIYAAGTLPINPEGASPVLTLDQVWAGLDLKVRKPELFLPVIDTCKVLEDDGESVLREVQFKKGQGPFDVPVQERITHIKPLSNTTGSGVETFSTVGTTSRVLNIVSTGGSESELYMTFTFEWEHKEIQAGSTEALEKQKNYQIGAPKAVGGTVAKIREMVKAGEL